MQGQSHKLPEDVEAAWRYFLVNWIGVGVMGAVFAFCLLDTGSSTQFCALAIAVGYTGLYGGFAPANAWSPARRDPWFMFVLGGIAQIVLITAIMVPLSSVLSSADISMQDRLHYGSAMVRWLTFAVPAVLAAAGHYRRVQEFTFSFGAALLATRLVDGSFYTVSAVLCIWALWAVPRLRPIVVLIGGVMLAATRFDGASYFVAVIAGVPIAALSIAAARWLGWIIERRALCATKTKTINTATSPTWVLR